MPNAKGKLCFVLMPFKDELKQVYWQAIKPACEKAGFDALRVDELKGAFNINRKIIEHIFASAAIVADLTGWNPNVFYELGVAHAIANKTLLIIQKQDKLPFDVSTYRCIQYEQTETGLRKLREEIVESLLSLEEWRQHPTNPVQDFKPHEAFIPTSELKQIQRQLQEKDERLRAAVPKTELEKWQREAESLKRELLTKEQLIHQSVAKSELETLQKELVQKNAEKAELQSQLERLRLQLKTLKKAIKSKPTLSLRSQPLAELFVEKVQQMLKERDFSDLQWNDKGKGVQHQYAAIERDGEKLVIDHTTSLMWQQSGSPENMNYADAEKYIRNLNQKNFAGYNDWRLPTLEEAMSLMEPKKRGNLYIDSLFDQTQVWIWTVDKENAGVAWVVGFSYGGCYHYRVDFNDYYVRAVRGGQSNI